MGKFCREEHQHHYISKEFKSLDEIMDWMHAEELDTQFSCKGGYTSFEAAAKHRRMPNKIYWCNKNPRTKSYVPKEVKSLVQENFHQDKDVQQSFK